MFKMREISSKVKYIVDNFSSHQLASQIIFPRLDTLKYYSDNDYQKQIHNLVINSIGGFCIFNGSMGQVQSMINTLNSIAKVPLLFCADFENGLIMRLENGTEIPHAMALGRLKPESTKDLAKIVAEESKSIGVDMILAPVCDINNNPNNPIINIRSFGDNIHTVVEHSQAYFESLKEQSVIACAKHFPGHGDTDIDSHLKLPILNKSKNDLLNFELIPFQKLINSGIDAIMVGHLALPSMDKSNLPASLSKKIIEDLLIKEMGFDGLIITDALEMKALTENFDEKFIIYHAVNAGNNILLMPENTDHAIKTLTSFIEEDIGIKNKAIQSSYKILQMKENLKKFQTRYEDTNLDLKLTINAKYALKAALETLEIKGDKSLIPVKNNQQIAGFAFLQNGNVNSATLFFQYLAQAIENDCDFGFVNKNISDSDVLAFKQGIKFAEIIILAFYFKPTPYESFKIPDRIIEVARKLSIGKKIILINFGNPYANIDITADLTIKTFSDSMPSMAATVIKLSGKEYNFD